MWRWLLKRRIRRDLVENVRYVEVMLRDKDGSSKLYHVCGFDDEYLRFIDLKHFGSYAIRWSDINPDWQYLGVDEELWHYFENLAQRRDLEKLLVKQAINSLEGNRYHIPAYQDPDGKWFYITQSHNFQSCQGHWSVVLYRDETDDSPGMRTVPYCSLKGGLEWELGAREQRPKWGMGIHYSRPHHWLTVDAIEAKEGVLPWGNVLYQTQREGITRYHIGRTTIHPELLPEATAQPMAVNDDSIRSILQSQLRHHYVDPVTVLGYVLDQAKVYRDLYPKFVQDFMAGLLPGQRLTLSNDVALVSGPYDRMAVLQHANRNYSHLGLLHVQDGTGRMHKFGYDQLRQLRTDLNVLLHACGVKAEHRFINFEVE